jgi:hypothetical protein
MGKPECKMKRFVYALNLFFVFGSCSGIAAAEARESCLNMTTLSVPSRPTIANATDVTQCGVVEVEYGLERQWPGAGANRDDLAGGLRIGLARNLDFHWSSAAFCTSWMEPEIEPVSAIAGSA